MTQQGHKETSEEVARKIAELEEDLSRPLLDLSDPKKAVAAAKEAPERSGNLLMLLIGFVLAISGGYLIVDNIVVTSGYWSLFGPSTFGYLLIPFVLGVGLLAFGGGKGRIGAALCGTSVLLMIVDVIGGLQLYFRTATLFQVLAMFALLAVGLGLIARATRN